ncbi:MAG: hypothetical protein KME46_02825 [Brasilonema angustatum HA4187-MV1]|nr:hypothetical protein [Brasilonema angustatum HA4187-MV1]
MRLREPDIIIKVVGEPKTPPKSTLDPEILCWCEDNNFVLVTNNRTSILTSQVSRTKTDSLDWDW